MKITPPSNEENKIIDKGIATDSDNPEWSNDMFRSAVRGRQKAPINTQAKDKGLDRER